MEEISAARSILRQTNVMNTMKEKMPDRYLKLEEGVSRGIFGKEVSRDFCGTKIDPDLLDFYR